MKNMIGDVKLLKRYCKEKREILLIGKSEFFDAKWYKNQYLKRNAFNPAKHYYKNGWKENYNPSEKFSTKEYLEKHPELVNLGLNPLLHYEKLIREYVEIIRKSEFFDAQWYRKTYDISARIDCAEHYYKYGWKEGYNPSVYFSTKAYLKENPDVIKEEINPLLHYELYGREEFRMFRCL